MQRKNYLLKSSYKSGIAMVMAIIVIVIMGTIMALSLSLTSLTTKRTNDLYLYEQSSLLAKSATEYALLLIGQRDPCSDINTTFRNFDQETIYRVNIEIQYIYYDDPSTAGINEAEVLCSANHGTLFSSVSTPEQNGSALIDVSVSVNDGNVSVEPIRYFRRTLQKL